MRRYLKERSVPFAEMPWVLSADDRPLSENDARRRLVDRLALPKPPSKGRPRWKPLQGFRDIGEQSRYAGAMAQDVLAVRPDAVI